MPAPTPFTRLTFLWISVVTVTSAVAADPLLFDMGTASSPLADGFTRVTANDLFDAQRGYGFLEAGHKSYLQIPVEKGPTFYMSTVGHFNRHATPVLVDGVRDTKDVAFKAKVPPGRYRVTVSMGDFNTPMGCVSLYVNGQLVEQNLRFHHGMKRRVSGWNRPWSWGQGATGFYDRIRFTVDAPAGSIVIKAVKDTSEFDRLMILEKQKEPAFLAVSKVGRPDVAPYVDIGEPFVNIPLLGVEIRPYVEPPIVMPELGTLQYNGTDANVALAVRQFNAKNFADAEAALDSADPAGDPLAQGLVYMWLAGWPAYDEEARIVPKVRKCLRRAPKGVVRLEALETFKHFDQGLTLHLNRNKSDSFSHFDQNVKACHQFQFAQPGDPLYWKSKIHAARCAYQLDPLNKGNGAAATADVWFREILEVFPYNRYARYFLTREYDPQGVWALPDYSAKTTGAPDWAANIYEAYNRVVDLSEWWVDNKQSEDGSIGGGWSDDVEFCGLFGYVGSISEGATPKSTAGAAKLVNGMYAAGEIDPETGFVWNTADTEHSTESTGDTLPMMIQIDFGNPIWIERAMQSAKLMRNLWTGFNSRGQRLFRSFYVGGMGIGEPGNTAAVDEKWAWRGVNPIDRVYWYNQHPAIGQLITEWAEGRLMTAMSTEKGKPKGFICEQIAFEDGAPGGVGDRPWYGVIDIMSKGFGHRHPYSIAPFIAAFRMTGDAKFLEPIRLEAQWYTDHPDVEEDRKAPLGSPEHIKWAVSFAHQVWPGLQEALGEVADDLDARSSKTSTIYEQKTEECESGLKQFREYWPLVTTEASATDRAGPAGLAFILFDNMSVSYQGLGRDFAAIVAKDTMARLRVAMYVFKDGEISMAIRPWKLLTGWTYQVNVAPDENLDEKPDSPGETFEFTLGHRGEYCPIRLDGRKTYLISFEPLRQERDIAGLPDLAIAPTDIEFNSRKLMLSLRVHNIGIQDVQEVPVALYESTAETNKLIGRSKISYLEWPKTFDAQTLKLGWKYLPKSKQSTFTAIIDPDDTLEEICETNNAVSATLTFSDEDLMGKENRAKRGR